MVSYRMGVLTQKRTKIKHLNYFDPRDIHVYSIDESFIDATHYLESMRMTTQELAKKLMDEIAEKLHIPSTAGIGTNLYLAKIPLDITAKHTKQDKLESFI